MNEINSLPYHIEYDVGEIKEAESLCPGVYYVSARDSERGLPHEYYIADKDASPLSEQAKAYGTPVESDERLLMFPLDRERGGGPVVKYEVQKYRSAHEMPPLDGEGALPTAVYGAEQYPEYFGDYPAPLLTPKGMVTRHKRLARGVFVLETERFERMIAVCCPVWSCDLSDYTLAKAEQLESDAREGIDNTLGYLFFPESAGCLALFELWKWYDEFMASGLIDRAAMMNAIWRNHPEYAAIFNRREQEGLNDGAAHFWHWLGYDVQPEGEEENLIRLVSDVGTEYLRF